ncbi:caspase family protein [Streptomyces sp. NPDC046887]|uniref:caspase family protein n=1 Tax=Streptomyces sp. NPDC046887 TaxID=3155472 RepID=UPI0033D1EA52
MRRFLIAAGTSMYREGSGLPSLPLAGEDAERLAAFLTTPAMGYTRVLEKVSTDPTADEFENALTEWSSGAGLTAEDVVLLYYAGHGDRPADRSYRLACADSRPGSPRSWLSLANIAEILADSPLRHVLFVIDACHAAAGAAEFQGVTESIVAARPRGDTPGSGTWVLASARHRDLADDGAFAARLIEACERGDGPSQRHLAPSALAARVNESFLAEGGRRQRATCSAAHQVEPPPFFPNPRYDPAAEADEGATAADIGDLRSHFEPRGRGVEHVHDPGSYFTGRAAALTRLREHLSGPGGRGALAVTAAPGSGKSAVLGRLVLDGCSDVSVNARHQTLDALVARLAAAADITAADPPSLLRSLAARRAPFRIVVDSLDEAGPADDRTEAGRIAWELLRPLGGVECVRLVVGSRRELLPHLGERLATMDLDSAAYADDTSTAEYVRRVLTDPPSPYTGRPAEAGAVAAEVARRSGRCFLVARMTATALLRGEVVDISVPGWADALPSDVGGAFDAYLRRLPPARRQSAMALLTTLAFGEGQGLPRKVWLAAARRLTGIDLREADIDALAEEDESYLTCLDAAGVKHFRLYHQELTDHLRRRLLRSRDLKDVQQAFVDVLLDLTPERRWADAPPYVRAHLATHAAGAEAIGGLIEDPAFLLAADPAGLLPAVRHPSCDPMTALVVERCADILGTTAPAGLDRAARLAFTAESLGVPALARRAEELSPSVRRVRVEARPVTPHRIVGRHEESSHHSEGAMYTWRTEDVVFADGTRAVLGACPPGSALYVWMVDAARRSGGLPHPATIDSWQTLPTRAGPALVVTLDAERSLRLWNVDEQVLLRHEPDAPYDTILDAGRLPDGRLVLVCRDRFDIVLTDQLGVPLLRIPASEEYPTEPPSAFLVPQGEETVGLVVCDTVEGTVTRYAVGPGRPERTVLLRGLSRPRLVRRTSRRDGAALAVVWEPAQRGDRGRMTLVDCVSGCTRSAERPRRARDGNFVRRGPGDVVYVSAEYHRVCLLGLHTDQPDTRAGLPLTDMIVMTPFASRGGGVHAVVAGFGGGLRVVDCLSGRVLGPPLDGHESAVCCLKVIAGREHGAPDVLSISNDGTVRLWRPVLAEEPAGSVRDSGDERIERMGTPHIHAWPAHPADYVLTYESGCGLWLVEGGALDQDDSAHRPLNPRHLPEDLHLVGGPAAEDGAGALHFLGRGGTATVVDGPQSGMEWDIGLLRLRPDRTVTVGERHLVPAKPSTVVIGHLLPGTSAHPDVRLVSYDSEDGRLLDGPSVRATVPVPWAGSVSFDLCTAAFRDREGRAVLVVAASDSTRAVGHFLDVSTGRALRDKPRELPAGLTGLTALHQPDGTRFLVAESAGRGVAVLDLDTDRLHTVAAEWPARMSSFLAGAPWEGRGEALRWVRTRGGGFLLALLTDVPVYPGEPRRLLLWDPAHPTTPARELPVQARRLLWSGQAPTGEALLAVSDQHGVRLVHLPSGEDVWSAPLPALVTSLALRPGSPHLDMGIATQQGVVLIRPRLTPAWRRRLLGDGV